MRTAKETNRMVANIEKMIRHSANKNGYKVIKFTMTLPQEVMYEVLDDEWYEMSDFFADVIFKKVSNNARPRQFSRDIERVINKTYKKYKESFLFNIQEWKR